MKVLIIDKTTRKHTKVILLCSVVIFSTLNFGNFVTKGTSIHNNRDANILKVFRGRYVVLPDKVIVEEVKIVKPEVKEIIVGNFVATAYTINHESTGKSRGDSSFGITSNGYDLKGKTRASAQTVAINNNIVPIGSKVKLEFIDEKYKKYNGIYYNNDQGGAIKGHKLDLFIGDTVDSVKRAINFGKTEVIVTILKD